MGGVRRIVRAALAATMVCAATLMCTGCIGIGGSGSSGLTASQSVLDTWELYYIEFPEGTVYAEDADVSMTLTFDKNGICTSHTNDGSQPAKGYYTMSGSTVEVDGIKLTMDGDYLTGTYKDSVMCFRRV